MATSTTAQLAALTAQVEALTALVAAQATAKPTAKTPAKKAPVRKATAPRTPAIPTSERIQGYYLHDGHVVQAISAASTGRVYVQSFGVPTAKSGNPYLGWQYEYDKAVGHERVTTEGVALDRAKTESAIKQARDAFKGVHDPARLTNAVGVVVKALTPKATAKSAA